MLRELAENPPAERLLQIYFAAKEWWTPPQFADADAEEAETWAEEYPHAAEGDSDAE